MAVLECRGVTKSFGGSRVLPPVDFSLGEGEHLAITGPSGSGKTTLLRIVAGLIQPTAGEVLEDDRAVNRPGACKAPHTRRIGMLCQGLGLWPHLRVRENVGLAVPRRWQGSETTGLRGRSGRVEDLLAQVGLSGLAHRYPGDLSGGERQRVAWARAVAAEPRLLLLDEPLTSLDPRLREDLLGLVAQYGRAPGRTIVVVTHDPDTARRLGGRVLDLGKAL